MQHKTINKPILEFNKYAGKNLFQFLERNQFNQNVLKKKTNLEPYAEKLKWLCDNEQQRLKFLQVCYLL